VKRAAALLATLVALAGLAGCDDRECLEGHYVTSTSYAFTGKSTVPIVTTTYVCDQYAPTPEEGDTP
jgi:hypothetical protein